MWQPFKTHPRDGRDFLAASVTILDETDEDGRIIVRGKKVREAYIVYYIPAFDAVLEKTYRGVVRNRVWTHWRPLPELPPASDMDESADCDV